MPDEEDDEEFFLSDATEAFIVESWVEPGDTRIKSLWEWQEPEEIPLKIAICGAGGTGKKALAMSLAQKLNIPCISGVSRQCQKLGYKLNKAATFEDEMAIFFGHMWAALEYDEFVSAGTIVDTLAYMHYIVDKTGTQHQKLLGRAITNCVNVLATLHYSVFFYLPLEAKPQSDGVRSVDMKFQTQIDANIKYYLNAFDIDYLPLSGAKKSKFNTAHKYLEEFGLLFDRE